MLPYLFCAALWFAEEQPLQISVSSNPPLPPQSLLRNGSFEDAEGGRPRYWSWGTAMPENFEAAWTKEGRGGSHCIVVRSKSEEMSGYWSQSVDVEPDRQYLLTGWYRLLGGRLLVYAHGRAAGQNLDARFYAGSPVQAVLVPEFLKPEYVIGGSPDQWQPFKLTFRVPPGMKAIAISAGMYFTPGVVWFDDFSLTPAETTLQVQVTSQDAIKRVTLVRLDTSATLWDSGELTGQKQHRFEATIPGVPTDASYEVAVHLADGRVARQRYPQGEQ
ncbi:MAG: hypothetical protein H5T86_08435 [Armatimonadetes bacterium]|nr:hypothetical protein [Armatimonadota bacterium]